MSENYWAVEAILEFLRGPMFTHPVMSFVDENCLLFDNEEENSFEHTKIHEQFKEMVELLISDALAEMGLSTDDFYRVLADIQDDQIISFVTQTIMSTEDFLLFKAMMCKRNLELTNQVLVAIEQAKQPKKAPAAASPPVQPVKEESLAAWEDLDEEEMMALALQLSSSVYEEQVHKQNDIKVQMEKEEAELAAAIAESLAEIKQSTAAALQLARLEESVAVVEAVEDAKAAGPPAAAAAPAAAATPAPRLSLKPVSIPDNPTVKGTGGGRLAGAGFQSTGLAGPSVDLATAKAIAKAAKEQVKKPAVSGEAAQWLQGKKAAAVQAANATRKEQLDVAKASMAQRVSSHAGGAPSEADLDARRAVLREKLADKMRTDLMVKSMGTWTTRP